jgi:hypothetical protein
VNYINRLKADNEDMRSQILFMYDWLKIVERYLMLPKFREDPTVQKADILLRMEECAKGLMDPNWRQA